MSERIRQFVAPTRKGTCGDHVEYSHRAGDVISYPWDIRVAKMAETSGSPQGIYDLRIGENSPDGTISALNSTRLDIGQATGFLILDRIVAADFSNVPRMVCNSLYSIPIIDPAFIPGDDVDEKVETLKTKYGPTLQKLKKKTNLDLAIWRQLRNMDLALPGSQAQAERMLMTIAIRNLAAQKQRVVADIIIAEVMNKFAQDPEVEIKSGQMQITILIPQDEFGGNRVSFTRHNEDADTLQQRFVMIRNLWAERVEALVETKLKTILKDTLKVTTPSPPQTYSTEGAVQGLGDFDLKLGLSHDARKNVLVTVILQERK